MLFPPNAITVTNYIQSGNGTTTILKTDTTSTLLYFSMEKTSTVGELHLHNENTLSTSTLIGHLDEKQIQNFVQIPFKELLLERDTVGTNDSFISLTYVPEAPLNDLVATNTMNNTTFLVGLFFIFIFFTTIDFIRRVAQPRKL